MNKPKCAVDGCVARNAICGYSIVNDYSECGAPDSHECGHKKLNHVDDLPCPFCGCECDSTGWRRSDGKTGPECEECGSSAPDMETWNSRYTGKPDMSYD